MHFSSNHNVRKEKSVLQELQLQAYTPEAVNKKHCKLKVLYQIHQKKLNKFTLIERQVFL